MTEKRFRVNKLLKYNYSDIGEYIDENHTDKPLRNDDVVELLNELLEEKEMWKRKAKWYKESLERKGYKVKCKELEE